MNKQSTTRTGWSLTGAVAAAIAASVCCVGPLVLVALGIGGAWISKLTVLEPLRPLFIVMTLGFLALGFYRAYRRPKDEQACGEGGSCVVPGSRRLNRLALWIGTPVLLGLLAIPYLAPRFFPQPMAMNSGDAMRVVLTVENMSCSSCPVTVRKSLMRVDGVKDVQVTIDPPRAVVLYDAAKVPIEALTAATTKAGYPSSVMAPAAVAGCCEIPSTALTQATDAARSTNATTAKIDPTHEVVFKVAKLECSLVNGVGCGHLLAPAMARLDRVDGVARTYSNWTGTLLRVSVAPTADREAVAERAKTALAADEQQPTRIEGGVLNDVLKKEDWRDTAHIVELSSYEFRTFAKHQVNAFADNEGLEEAKREKLLDLVDDVWDQSARGVAGPKPDASDYSAYWHGRRDKFIAAFTDQAKNVLTAEQIEKLLRDYSRHSWSPTTLPQANQP